MDQLTFVQGPPACGKTFLCRRILRNADPITIQLGEDTDAAVRS